MRRLRPAPLVAVIAALASAPSAAVALEPPGATTPPPASATTAPEPSPPATPEVPKAGRGASSSPASSSTTAKTGAAPGPITPRTAQPLTPESLRVARRLVLLERNLGWGLSGAGIVALAVGGVLFGTSYAGDVRFDDGAVARTSGLITMGVGAGLLIPGIVLAVHGQKRLAEVDWRLKELRPVVVPLAGGVVIGATARF